LSIFDKPPEAWNEGDLRELLGPPPQRETLTLEFKRELSQATGAEKAEVEKDVHGLANHGEGVLIYGVAEIQMEDGSEAAGELTPVDGALAEQLNNVLDGRGDPCVPFDLHVIDAQAGGVYIAVVVYGQRRPHMASNGRYYPRRNLQVRQMTEAEVAEAYRDRMIRDRRMTEGPVPPDDGAERAAELADVAERVHHGLTPAEMALYTEQTGETTRPGWLSVVAHPVPLRPNLVNPAEMQPDVFYGIDMNDRWRQIEAPLTHYQLHPALHGFFAQSPDRDDTYPRYLVRFWRDGLFELGDLLEPPFRDPAEMRVIPTHAVAQYVHDFLTLFGRTYSALGYEGHVRAEARFDHVAGYTLGVDLARMAGQEPHPLEDDAIVAEPRTGPVADLEASAARIALDLSQRLFLAAGDEGPTSSTRPGTTPGRASRAHRAASKKKWTQKSMVWPPAACDALPPLLERKITDRGAVFE
jgi:hypothetical protein